MSGTPERPRDWIDWLEQICRSRAPWLILWRLAAFWIAVQIAIALWDARRG